VFFALGGGLALRLGRIMRATLVAALISVAIELLQRFVIPGRYPSLGDIFANVAGAYMGAVAVVQWPTLVHPRAHVARRLAAAAAVVWLGFVAFFGWTIGTSVRPRELWGQWAADFVHLDTFRGQLLYATIDAEPFPWTRSDHSAALRARLLSDRLLVTASVIPDSTTSRLAPVVSMSDATQAEVLLLGQVGTAAVFRMRTRASDVGLWSPEAMLDDAFPNGPSPRILTLAVSRAGPIVTLMAASNGDSSGVRRATPLGPALGWTLLLPPSQAPRFARWLLTALWLGVMLVPAAYWSGAGASARALGTLVAAMAAGLLAIPLLQRVAVPPPATWIVCILLGAFAFARGSRNRAGAQDVRASLEEAAAAAAP
jgi:hypothetical protein